MNVTPQTVILDLPLKHIWTAFLTPSRLATETDRIGHLFATLTGHHYAIDFVKLGEDMKRQSTKSWYHYLSGRATAEDYYAWSQPVYAPLDRVIVTARDGWPDRKALGLWKLLALLIGSPNMTADDLRLATGNYVLIQSGEAVVLLAHLRNGSLKVSENE